MNRQVVAWLVVLSWIAFAPGARAGESAPVPIAPGIPTTGAQFGAAVAASGDWVACGEVRNGIYGVGAIQAFRYANGVYVHEQTLLAGAASASGGFGQNVAMDGDTLVAGAPGDAGSGRAYVFVLENEAWKEQATLAAQDGAVGDAFGACASVHGDIAVVGAPKAGTGEAGAVYVFRRRGGLWLASATLSAPDAAVKLHFGAAVDVWGDTIVVGATGLTTGGNQGNAYFFWNDGSQWILVDDFSGRHRPRAGSLVGGAVAIAGDKAVVSASSSIYSGVNTIYPFSRYSTIRWHLDGPPITASDSQGNNTQAPGFGLVLDLSTQMLVVGCPDGLVDGTATGAVYAYGLSGLRWTEVGKMTINDGVEGEGFGYAVVASGTTAIAGAPFDTTGLLAESGKAFVAAKSLSILSLAADVNLDGTVDATDLQHVIRFALADLPGQGYSDVNHDGRVDAVDVQIVLNVLLT